jgi:SprT protein
MVDALQDFIPPASFDQVTQLLIHDNLVVKIKKERKTRHGDYRRLPNGNHQIQFKYLSIFNYPHP